MRHRKKLLFATTLLAGAYAALFFWPHTNPEAVRALDMMRGMIEIVEAAEASPVAETKFRDDVMIELRVATAAINMTDATAGLFAPPGRKREKTVVGRVKSTQRFLVIAHSTSSINIDDMSLIQIQSGQKAGIVSGAEVEVAPASLGRAAAPLLVQDPNAGTNWTIGARITAAGMIEVELEFKQTRSGRKRTEITDAGPKVVTDVHSISAKARAELKTGESLVVGGLSQKRPECTMVKLPGLSELPGVGSWFSFRQEREIEEELVILVTPRIVTPVAAVERGR